MTSNHPGQGCPRRTIRPQPLAAAATLAKVGNTWVDRWCRRVAPQPPANGSGSLRDVHAGSDPHPLRGISSPLKNRQRRPLQKLRRLPLQFHKPIVQRTRIPRPAPPRPKRTRRLLLLPLIDPNNIRQGDLRRIPRQPIPPTRPRRPNHQARTRRLRQQLRRQGLRHPPRLPHLRRGHRSPVGGIHFRQITERRHSLTRRLSVPNDPQL